jgi:hypothetical protein
MRHQCQFTVKRSEERVGLTVAAEQQPCGVQVVERVGLVASSFQFFTRLAAVFAEEVGGFWVIGFISGVKRCFPVVWAIIKFRIHIRTFGNQQFNDFLVTSD